MAKATPKQSEPTLTSWNMGLSHKEIIFVENVVKGVSLTQSALKAGYKKSNAGQMGSQMNKKPHVQAAIQQLMAEVVKRIEISAEKVLQEVATIAHSNMKDFATWGAAGLVIKESTSLTPQQSAAIAEVYDAPKRGKGVKLYDKLSALKLLGEYVGVFKKDAVAAVANGPTIKVYSGIDPSKV